MPTTPWRSCSTTCRRSAAGVSNPQLAQFVVEDSCSVAEWMAAHGIRWQKPLAGTINLGRTNRFFLGGGKALINTYYQTAERMGVEVEYDSPVVDIEIDDGSVSGVVVERNAQRTTYPAKAVVLTSGGFEANLEWLRRYWGDGVDNYIVRGTPENDGTVLAAMLDRGAATAGDPKGFHAIAVDARAPKFDGGIATRLDSIPFGIALNKHGRRFFDEGQDIWPKRYAIWGRLIAEQEDQIAYSIVDSQDHRRVPDVAVSTVRGRLDRLAGGAAWARSSVRDADRRRVQPIDSPRRNVRHEQAGRLSNRGPGPAQEPLGAANRQAAVLRLPAPTGHHLYLPWVKG